MQQEYEEISNRWVDDMFVSKASGFPDVVYHYTDATGLCGMLRTGKVWATDFRFLNDRSEIQYTRKLAMAMISKRLEETTDTLLTRLYGQIMAHDFGWAADAYIFSMSEDPDDLSQWRGYARDGQGFTVGFCGHDIFVASEPDEAPFGFVQVEYDEERQLEPFRGSLAELEACLRRGAATPNADLARLTEGAASWFGWIVANLSSKNKHKSFHGEREWRVVSKVYQGTDDPNVRVRASGARLVRYLELPLGIGGDGKLPIKKIGIGPGFPESEERHAVEALCKETKYHVDIYSADTPYRRL